MENVVAPERALPKFKLHWHVLFVHFPISFFGVAFAFQILHLFMSPACFELATNATLIAGAAMLVPTIWSGWRTWKSKYRGARAMIFRRKINIAFTMLVFSVGLLGWRIISFGAFVDVPYSPAHWVFLAGNTLLMAGAVAEGYYGGRLNHH